MTGEGHILSGLLLELWDSVFVDPESWMDCWYRQGISSGGKGFGIRFRWRKMPGYFPEGMVLRRG